MVKWLHHSDLVTSTRQEADLCQELGLSGSLLTASSALSLLLHDMCTGMCVFVCALMANKLDWMDAHFLTTVNSTCTKMGWSCRAVHWLSERHNEQLFFRASHHLKCYLWYLMAKTKIIFLNILYIFRKNFVPISLKTKFVVWKPFPVQCTWLSCARLFKNCRNYDPFLYKVLVLFISEED